MIYVLPIINLNVDIVLLAQLTIGPSTSRGVGEERITSEGKGSMYIYYQFVVWAAIVQFFLNALVWWGWRDCID